MFLSELILRALDPPSVPKVYDTPPWIVSTPRFPRLTRLLSDAVHDREPQERAKTTIRHAPGQPPAGR